jgi:hypothetical protein
MRAAIGSALVLAFTSRSARASAQDAPPAAPPPATVPEQPKIEAPPLASLPTGLVPPPEATPPPEPPPFEAPGLNELPADRARRAGQMTSDWDLAVGANGEISLLSYPNPNTSATSLRAGTAATLSRYLAPIIDDDAPRSLQPFLQRASVLSIGFGLSGFSTTTTSSNGVITSDLGKLTEIGLGPSLGANIYLTPAFALTAGFAYEYDVRTESDREVAFGTKTHRLLPQAGFGIRFGDTRIDLQYRFEGDLVSDQEERLPPAQWGSIVLGVETVIDRTVDLNFGGQVFDAGAAGSASVTVYPTKNVGIFGGGSGCAGRKYFNNDDSHNDYGGFVGAAIWFAPRVRGTFEYQIGGTTVPESEDVGSYSELRNEIDVTFTFRLP